jgi:hypothetical protein
VQLTSWPLTLHVHPVPLADVGVRPAGNESLTVTVVPSVAAVPPLVTSSVKLAVPLRVRVAALAVLVIVSDGTVGSAVLNDTDPDPALLSPPPTTLALLVSEAAALLATVTLTVTAG